MTGGGGYVGNELCKALCGRGYEVTAFDVQFLDNGEVQNLRKIKVQGLISPVAIARQLLPHTG